MSPALPPTHPFQTGRSLGAPSHTAGCSWGPDLEAGEAPRSPGCLQRVWTPLFQEGLVKWWVSEQEGVSESIYRRTFLTPAKTEEPVPLFPLDFVLSGCEPGTAAAVL